MSAPDMPGLEASDGPQATSTPPGPESAAQGLDDGAMGGPDAWAAVVAAFYGDGPAAPAIPSVKRLSVIEDGLSECGWQVRKHSTGGFFCWSKTGTKHCHDMRELAVFARKAAADARKDEAERKSAAADARKVKPKVARKDLRAAFLGALAVLVARTTARRGDQQGGSAS